MAHYVLTHLYAGETHRLWQPDQAIVIPDEAPAPPQGGPETVEELTYYGTENYFGVPEVGANGAEWVSAFWDRPKLWEANTSTSLSITMHNDLESVNAVIGLPTTLRLLPFAVQKDELPLDFFRREASATGYLGSALDTHLGSIDGTNPAPVSYPITGGYRVLYRPVLWQGGIFFRHRFELNVSFPGVDAGGSTLRVTSMSVDALFPSGVPDAVEIEEIGTLTLSWPWLGDPPGNRTIGVTLRAVKEVGEIGVNAFPSAGLSQEETTVSPTEFWYPA